MLRIVLITIALAAFGWPAGCDEPPTSIPTETPAVTTTTPTPASPATPPEATKPIPDPTPAPPTAAMPTTEPPACPVAQFFEGIAGEWVGVCRQSTDGADADDKYFHACIRRQSKSCFEARFDYYRLDDKGALARIGGSNVVVTVAGDCSATGRVTGDGEVLVDKKSKKQEHDLTESLTWLAENQLQARGSGSLKVYGMPLGLGKLGKVREDQSAWRVADGALSIQQTLSIVFRALCFSKSFKIEADYSAVRGSDVSSVVPKPAEETAKSGG